MNPTTLSQTEQTCFDSENTRRNRQACIRKSWTSGEKNRRREMATVQQLRLFEMLQCQLQRTAC